MKVPDLNGREMMIYMKKKTRIIIIFVLILGVFICGICFAYAKIQPWNETVQIMDEAFDMDIKSWKFDYEYENTLERSEYKGGLRVWFTSTPEHVEEVLAKYKDRMIVDTELESSDQLSVSRRLDIPEDALNENGRTVRFYTEPIRELDLKQKVYTCSNIIHTQKNEDGTVTVLFDYLEG